MQFATVLASGSGRTGWVRQKTGGAARSGKRGPDSISLDVGNAKRVSAHCCSCGELVSPQTAVEVTKRDGEFFVNDQKCRVDVLHKTFRESPYLCHSCLRRHKDQNKEAAKAVCDVCGSKVPISRLRYILHGGEGGKTFIGRELCVLQVNGAVPGRACANCYNKNQRQSKEKEAEFTEGDELSDGSQVDEPRTEIPGRKINMIIRSKPQSSPVQSWSVPLPAVQPSDSASTNALASTSSLSPARAVQPPSNQFAPNLPASTSAPTPPFRQRTALLDSDADGYFQRAYSEDTINVLTSTLDKHRLWQYRAQHQKTSLSTTRVYLVNLADTPPRYRHVHFDVDMDALKVVDPSATLEPVRVLVIKE